MPAKRKYSPKQRRFQRQRRQMIGCFAPKRVPMRKQIVSINRAPVSYTREFSYPNLQILTGNINVFNSYYFTLNSLPNYAEFTLLFDQYRIWTMIMKFRLIAPPEANNTITTQQYYPDISCTVDYDDSNVVTCMETIYQYGKCKRGILKPTQWFTYKFHPTVSFQLYRTSTTTAYAPAKSDQWLDLTYTDTPYYGLKVGIDASPIGAVQAATLNVEVHAVMIVEFKNSR